jgi:hypothetical protein
MNDTSTQTCLAKPTGCLDNCECFFNSIVSVDIGFLSKSGRRYQAILASYQVQMTRTQRVLLAHHNRESYSVPCSKDSKVETTNLRMIWQV